MECQSSDTIMYIGDEFYNSSLNKNLLEEGLNFAHETHTNENRAVAKEKHPTKHLT